MFDAITLADMLPGLTDLAEIKFEDNGINMHEQNMQGQTVSDDICFGVVFM